MIKFGMNLLLWGDGLNNGMIPVCEMLQKQGYNGVEIPIINPTGVNWKEWGKRLDGLGLERTAVTIGTAEANLISPDAAVRARGIEHLKRVLDACVTVGATVLCGPYHSALGQFSEKGPTADELKLAADGLRVVAEYAEQLDRTDLALEALNRFECYLVNCMQQLLALVRAVNNPWLGAMYDTYHAGHEEKNIERAVRTIQPELLHVHISENDRSTPGQGLARWGETFDALKGINYQHWLVVEAFGLALPGLAAATKIWRKMFESEEQLSRDALAFMRGHVGQRWNLAK